MIGAPSIPDSAPGDYLAATLSAYGATLSDSDGGRFKLVGNEIRATGSPAILRSDAGFRTVQVTKNGIVSVINITVDAQVSYSAAGLDGSSGYYAIPNSITFANNWAIFLPFTYTDVSSNTGVSYLFSVGGGLTANNVVHIGVNQPGAASNPSKPFCRVKNGALTQQVFVQTSMPTLVADGRPYALGVVYNDSGTPKTLKFYLYTFDTGVAVETEIGSINTGTAMTTAGFTATGGGKIGARANAAADFLKGNVRGVEIINYVPSSTTRLRLARGRRATDLSGAVLGSWQLDGSAATVTDASGAGNTATKTGGVTASTIALPQLMPESMTDTSGISGYQRGFQTTDDGTLTGNSSALAPTGPVWYMGDAVGTPANADSKLYYRVLDYTGGLVTDWTDWGAHTTHTFDKVANGIAFGRWIFEIAYGRQRYSNVILMGDVTYNSGQSNDARNISHNARNVVITGLGTTIVDYASNFVDPNTIVTTDGLNAPASPPDGVATKINGIYAATGRPQIYISAAVGGTAASLWIPGGANYINMLTCITRCTRGLFSFIEHDQGEADVGAGDPTDYTEFRTWKESMWGGLKTSFPLYPKAHPWLLMRQLACTNGSAVQTAWSDIQSVQLDLAEDNPTEIVYCGNKKYIRADDWATTNTSLHYEEYQSIMELTNLAQLKAMGVNSAGARGPKATGFQRLSTNNFRITFTHATGGTALATFGGGAVPNGFHIALANTFASPLTISTASISGANTVDVTTTGDDGVSIAYFRNLWGINPTRTNMIRDNYAYGMHAGRFAPPTSTQHYLATA